MKVTITLSANAGIAIQCGTYRIWVDALHDRKQTGFSAVDMPLQNQMLQCEAFYKPDAICFTHCHGDHFSKELTVAAHNLWPRAKVILPEPVFEDQLLVCGDEWHYGDGDLSLRFIRLIHDGDAYRDCIHYGILITTGNKNILIPGDCEIAASALAKLISKQKVDLALLNFPWLTLKKGRTFVQEYMKPEHIVLYHLPFVEDDCNGYRSATEKAAKEFQLTQVSVLMEPLQQIVFNI